MKWPVTDKLVIKLPEAGDSCSLSPEERVRVRASVQLTFLLRFNVRKSHRPCVSWQRMRCSFLERVENHVTDELLLSLQLPIPKAQFLDTHRSQELRSLRISRLLLRMPVMPAIEFDGETSFHAVEIEVVNPRWMIAPEFVGAEAPVAQPTPHEFFCPSLFLPQCAGAGCVGHARSLKRRGSFRKSGFATALTPALSPRRGRIVRRRSSWPTAFDCSQDSARISEFKTGGVS